MDEESGTEPVKKRRVVAMRVRAKPRERAR